jgi:hypothetical protein
MDEMEDGNVSSCFWFAEKLILFPEAVKVCLGATASQSENGAQALTRFHAQISSDVKRH